MKKYTFEGKTIEEAKNKAISELNTTEDNLIIKVLSEKQGLIKKVVKIEVINVNDVIAYLKDSIKEINYECNRFISDKSFVQKNRSIYKTKENGDIVLNEDLGYIFTADTPRRLNNEFKGCY